MEITETVVLNGVTGVPTTQEFIRVNRAYCGTVGSGGVNAGNITGTIGGNAQFYISATQGQTSQLQYTVPADKWYVITTLAIVTGRMSGTADIELLGQIRLWNGSGYNSWRTISDLHVYQNVWINDSTRTPLPPRTDLRMLIVSSGSTQIAAITDGYLVKSDRLFLPI